MLCVFPHDVLFDGISHRRRVKDSYTVSNVLSHEVQLNYVCVYIGLKLDSVLSVLKHLVFLDQIAHRAVL